MEFKSPLSRFCVCFGVLCAGIFQLHTNELHGEGRSVLKKGAIAWLHNYVTLMPVSITSG